MNLGLFSRLWNASDSVLAVSNQLYARTGFIAINVERSLSPIRSYWDRICSKLNQTKQTSDQATVKLGTTPIKVAPLPMLQQVALTLFDRYSMPAWSIDYEGRYLDPLNVTSKRMMTLFAETMCTERPPVINEVEREELVSKALALSTVVESSPTLFMTEEANWIMFPVDDTEACCVIVLVR